VVLKDVAAIIGENGNRYSKFVLHFSGVNYTAETDFWRLSKRISRRIRSHILNGFDPLIIGLGGMIDGKNRRKSRCTNPLSIFYTSL
jgi:hypothetical protein